MRDRVWSPDRVVGTVDWERCGLYWEFRSELQTASADFTRLYLHAADRSIRFGLYERDGARLRLSGKVSCRTVGELTTPYAYTICKEPFLPPELLPDAKLPFCAKKSGDGLCYRIPITELDDRTLPYFCFFRPHGESVLLTMDRDGMPVSR